jgi:predicted alpha/beta-hydrolase family hydrolase
MERVGAGLASRGVTVITFDFPYMAAKRRVPDPPPALEAAYREAYAAALVHVPIRAAAFVGGKSMGGRIASRVAAAGGLVPAAAGLLCFGYPLHPPGKPQQRRDRHLPGVDVPILFLHGTHDPFGTPAEMTALAASLPESTLHLVDGGDHSLIAGKRADPAGLLFERALDAAARWIGERSVPI